MGRHSRRDGQVVGRQQNVAAKYADGKSQRTRVNAIRRVGLLGFGRQSRAGTRANRNESAYGMLTAKVQVLKYPQFMRP